MAKTIVAKKMSVRSAERFAQAKREGKVFKDKSASLHPKCNDWATKINKKLSSKVKVILPETGPGKIIICVESAEEVEWLIESL